MPPEVMFASLLREVGEEGSRCRSDVVESASDNLSAFAEWVSETVR